MTKNVTFWSYKGGVGRTIALVNTAYQLAKRGKRVVIWEMDLEAPGLLKIPLFSREAATALGGVIDILEGVDDGFENLEPEIRRYSVEFRENGPDGEIRFHIIPAGKADESYHEKYSGFDWNTFFEGEFGYSVFEQLQRKISEVFEADFLLIDSRTGITDISAICCVQLPDTVVLVSTLAHQGMSGVAEMKRTIERRNEDTRLQERQIDTLFLISHVPNAVESKVDERLEAFRAEGLIPDFTIRLQEDLLLEERIVSHDKRVLEHPNAAEFAKLASRLSDRYLEMLAESTRWIDIRGLARGRVDRFDISRIYIRLASTAGEERGESVPLETALASRAAIIAGEPGGGKTTFLRWLAHQMLRGTVEPRGYPILIRLADLDAHIAKFVNDKSAPAAADSPKWLEHFLASQELPARLRRPDAIVLLDGLDEAATGERRAKLIRLIEQAAIAYPDARILVTTRPGGEAPAGFARFTIDPLDDLARAEHLRIWCELLLPDDPKAAERHHAELTSILTQNPGLSRLARNPMMLTAIVVTHWNNRRLPEQRAELLESIIHWLLHSRENSPVTEPAQATFLLGDLALLMQAHESGQRRRIELADAFEVISLEQIEALQSSSGIIQRNGQWVEFGHLLFQEYLAARNLARLRDGHLYRRINEQGWPGKPHMRETLVLLAGILGQHGSSRVRSLFDAIVEGAGDSLADRASRAALIRAMMRDLAPTGIQLDHPGYRAMASKMVSLFERGAAPELAASVRVEAAEALGEVGDPRLRLPAERDYWVWIPQATARLGAHKQIGAPGFDPDARDNETSRLTAAGGSWIGRFPVTVHEYCRFVDEGGDTPLHWQDQIRHPSRPVVGVTLEMAMRYCAFAGARLPSEDEWEFAARGPESRRFPWGEDQPDERRANFGAGLGCSPVGLFPDGATPEGVLDLAGNVVEWTVSGVVRGGSWRSVSPLDLRCARREIRDTSRGYDDAGFRCARDPLAK